MLRSICFCLATVALCAFASALLAAPPKLAELFPAGGQRGQTVAVTAAGEFASWPVDFWCDQPGVQITPDKDKGKISIVLAEDVTPGVCWIRAFNAEGGSSPRPFMIEQLAEVEEKETNDLPQQAESLTLPVVVNGRLAKSGDVDGFAVELKAGETLAARLQANWLLGSPMDTVLQVCERVERTTSAQIDKSPQVEAFVVAQNHDARGLDPALTYTARRDGIYIVRAFAFPSEPNSSIRFAGAENYIYRLTLTTSGLVEFALPLAWPHEASGEVELSGPNVAAAKFPLPATESPAQRWSTFFLPGAAGAAEVVRVEFPSALATEQALEKTGQPLTIPQVISGRLANPKTEHHFRFTAKKGEKLNLTVAARSFGYPLDAVLTILDSAGKELQEVDDAQKLADPTLTFAPAADGQYVARVRDLYGRGGAAMVYLLTAKPAAPDFAITVTGDAFALLPGKTVEIPLTVDRQNGLEEDIEIVAADLPPGITAEAVTSAGKGDTAKAVKLVLQAAEDAAPWQGAIRIVGKRKSDSPSATRYAEFAVSLPGARPQTGIFLVVAKP